MHVKIYVLGEESVNAKLFYFLIESDFITACTIQLTNLPEDILKKTSLAYEITRTIFFSYSLFHFYS